MGENRRYANLSEERRAEKIAASGPLQSLTREEHRAGSLPVTRDPMPSRVWAWVRFGATPLRVQGYAVVWTSCAVGVEFKIAGQSYRCWVWASAVEPLENDESSPPTRKA